MLGASLFPDDFHAYRASVATQLLAGILAARADRPRYVTVESLAADAVKAAEALLAELGLVNPDSIA